MNKQQDREEDRIERDDKFLVEVMKVLMKETGTSVEKLKETVDLTPKFSEGGDVDKFGALLEQMMREEGDDPGFERDTTGPPEIDTSMPSTDMPPIEVIQEMMTTPDLGNIQDVGFPATTGRGRPELVTSAPRGTEVVTEPKVITEEEKEFSLANVTPPRKPEPPKINYREVTTNSIANIFPTDKYGQAFNDALTASIDHETGGSFKTSTKQRKGPAKGLLQMEAGMRKDFEKYLEENDLMETHDSSLSYVKELMEGTRSSYDIGAGHRKRLREAIESNDPEKILESLTKDFFRPGKPRLKDRKKKLSALQNKNKKLT